MKIRYVVWPCKEVPISTILKAYAIDYRDKFVVGGSPGFKAMHGDINLVYRADGNYKLPEPVEKK